MTWYDMGPFDPPRFWAGVDIEKLRALAERCGGTVSERFDPRPPR